MEIVDPAEHGFDPERLARIDAMTHDYVDRGKLPCVQTVLARHGEVVHHDAYGWADLESDRRVTPDSIFRIYSMTKPVTSVAVMQLYEQGRLLLEDPVGRYLPALRDLPVWAGGTEEAPETVPAEGPVRLRHLLTHTAGFTYGFQYQHPLDAMYRSRTLGDFFSTPDYDLDGMTERLAQVPLLHQPGARWNYSMATDVLGAVVEAISGQPLDEYLAEHVFAPCGMVDTGFHVPEDQGDRFCSLYTRGKGATLRRMGPWDDPRTRRPPAFLSGGGGLVSTAADYLRFCHALLDGGQGPHGRILGSRTVDYMTLNHLPGDRTLNEMGQSTFAEVAMEGNGFGLGFAVIVDPAAAGSVASPGEYSWGGAASTAFWIDPLEDIAVVFLTQLLPSNTYPIRRQLRAVVNQALVD